MTYFNNKNLADNAVEKIVKKGGRARAEQVDVTDDESVAKLFESIRELDVMVFAVCEEKPLGIDDATLEDWRFVTAPMIDGAYLCTHYAVPLLKKSSNPNIIYIPSTDGIRPDGEYIAYQVSEAAIIALTTGNAKYLGKKYKIRVNGVCPGPVKTGLWDKAGANLDSMWDQFAEKNPMGRVTEAEDVARACLSFTEDSGHYLNGNLIFVNGKGGF